MTEFGKNMKITVDPAHRKLVEHLFVDCLGAKINKPRPDLDVYLLDDGFSLGAFYGAKSDALSPVDHKKAPWLEFRVADPESTKQKLASLGVEEFEYTDRTHSYYCPVSGPVFRLAKL